MTPPEKKIKTESFPDDKRIRHDCVIPVPLGYPNSASAFVDNCLIVSLAIGTLYNKAQEEKDEKKRKYLERSLANSHSEHKTKKECYRNLAGKLIMKRCHELLADMEGVSMPGPHPYKIIRQLVKKRAIRVLIYKDNKIKYAIPSQYDGTRAPIALLESIFSCLDGESRRHVDFLKNPRKFYGKKIYQCPLCLENTSQQRNHSKCERKVCLGPMKKRNLQN